MDEESAPKGIDTSKPSIARAYDYFLGGKDNFAADREMAEQILALYPQTAQMCRDNRAFIARAVTWAANRGITQFLDLGSGLPTSPAVHETAREVIPAARACYVDNDPVAVLHSRALMLKGAGPGVAAVAHDLAECAAVLADRDVLEVIRPGEPVCLIFASVLHFYPAAVARTIVGAYLGQFPPGSVAVISCMRVDDAGLFERGSDGYTAAGVYNFTREEMGALFTGTELVPPGVALAAAWRGGMPVVPHAPAGAAYILGGVGVSVS
ncbi:MAG TPA: SAM-dependent methyltransferase [Trebonia sp.]|jgi:hypothetical protein|nr:SAM-dependent methyltransferase [Trebonia sp.]